VVCAKTAPAAISEINIIFFIVSVLLLSRVFLHPRPHLRRDCGYRR
jgi:hypothetical protein